MATTSADTRAATPTAGLTWRRLRLALHVARGMLLAATLFPLASSAGRQALIRNWSRRLLALSGMTLVVHQQAEPLDGGVMVVSNHVSWIDIYVIDAWRPTPFVSKAEIGEWPVIGWLARTIGTVFIQREKRADARRIVQQLAAILSGGGQIAVFAEGTTSDGLDLLAFHSNLFEAAVVAGVPVQPICIMYEDAQGRQSLAPAFVGDMNLFDSLAAVLRAKPLKAHLYVGTPLAPHADRRVLMRAAHQAVRQALLTLQAATLPPLAADVAAVRAVAARGSVPFGRPAAAEASEPQRNPPE